ncbi:MAG: hypothetical protein V2A67_06940 [Bacteroidota bacterium]
MIRKLLVIVLAFAIITSSIGYQVIQHHCIWCGGDRVELIIVGNMEESHDSCCHNEKDKSNHNCGKDDCCLPGLLKLDNALSSEDGHHLVKVTMKVPVINPFILPNNSSEELIKPSEGSLINHTVRLSYKALVPDLIAFRC